MMLLQLFIRPWHWNNKVWSMDVSWWRSLFQSLYCLNRLFLYSSDQRYYLQALCAGVVGCGAAQGLEGKETADKTAEKMALILWSSAFFFVKLIQKRDFSILREIVMNRSTRPAGLFTRESTRILTPTLPSLITLNLARPTWKSW